MPESPAIARTTFAKFPVGSRQVRVCETWIERAGETFVEIVDYNEHPAPGRDPHGAGAIVPLDRIDDLIDALQKIKERHQA